MAYGVRLMQEQRNGGVGGDLYRMRPRSGAGGVEDGGQTREGRPERGQARRMQSAEGRPGGDTADTEQWILSLLLNQTRPRQTRAGNSGVQGPSPRGHKPDSGNREASGG